MDAVEITDCHSRTLRKIRTTSLTEPDFHNFLAVQTKNNPAL
ncbi:hypothetical protein l13_17090 [Neisseria weaveri ATCC 51223]|nr:hypothetical protein l13_17090 [Neisseria weaveri ATCC 51223]